MGSPRVAPTPIPSGTCLRPGRARRARARTPAHAAHARARPRTCAHAALRPRTCAHVRARPAHARARPRTPAHVRARPRARPRARCTTRHYAACAHARVRARTPAHVRARPRTCAHARGGWAPPWGPGATRSIVGSVIGIRRRQEERECCLSKRSVGQLIKRKKRGIKRCHREKERKKTDTPKINK